MIEMQLKCVFCKRFLNSCLDIHNPTECTEFISPFEDIKECFQIPFLHVSGDDGICSECFIVIRFINSMKSNMFSALKNEKCTVITIFNQYKQILCSIQFQNNEHLEEMYATVCTETQPDQYKETKRARTPSSGEVYGILKKNKAQKRKRVNSNMGRSSANNVRTASRASSTASISSFASRGLRSEPIYDPNRCNLESRMGFDDYDKENEDDDDDDDDVETIKRFRCQECSIYFSSQYKLLQHTSQQHSFCIYCPLCETLERNVVELQKHLEYHQVVSIPCGFCEKSFVNYEKMSVHRKNVHKNKSILLPPRIRMNVVFRRSLQYAKKSPKKVVTEKPFERSVYVNEDGNHFEKFNHHDTYCVCMNEYLKNDHIKMHDTYCNCKTVQSQSPRSDVDEFDVGTSIIYRQRDTSDSSDPEVVDHCVPSTSTAPTPPPRIQEPSSTPIQNPKLTEMNDTAPPAIQKSPSPIQDSLSITYSAPPLSASTDRQSPPLRGFSPPRNSTPPPVLEASLPLECPHLTADSSDKPTLSTKEDDSLPPQLSAEIPKHNGGVMPMDKVSIYKQFIHDDSGKMNGCSDNVQIKRVTRSTGKQTCSEDGAIPSTSKQYYEQYILPPVDKPKNQLKKTSKGNIKSKSPPADSGLLVVEVIKPPSTGETSVLNATNESPKVIVEDSVNNDEIMTKDGEFILDSQEVIQYEDIGTVEEIIEEVIESNWQDQVKDWGEDSHTKSVSIKKKRNFFETFINSHQQEPAAKKSVYDTFICRDNSKNKCGAKAAITPKVAPMLDNLDVYVVNPNGPGAASCENVSKESEEIAVPSTTQIESLPGTSDPMKRSSDRTYLLKLMDDFQKKKKPVSETTQIKTKTPSSTSTSSSASSTIAVLPSSTPSIASEKVAIATTSSMKKSKRKLNKPVSNAVAVSNTVAVSNAVVVSKRLGMSNVVRSVNNPPTSSELIQVDGELYTKNAYKHAKKKVKR